MQMKMEFYCKTVAKLPQRTSSLQSQSHEIKIVNNNLHRVMRYIFDKRIVLRGGHVCFAFFIIKNPLGKGQHNLQKFSEVFSTQRTNCE